MQREDRKMLQFLNTALKAIDDLVWGVPLIVLILATGIYLTVRLKGMQIRKLPAALRYMVQNEEEGSGEVTSFGALCTAMSATIGTGNIVGVATAIVAGGPGALFWMWIAAFFGMATKYSEGLLAIKFRTFDDQGNVSGVRINVPSGAVTNAQEAGIAVKTAANQQALCRPMITIFK